MAKLTTLSIGVNYALELLHHVVVGDVANISKVNTASIFRVDPRTDTNN
jgi:hypothetical protein